MLRLPLRGNMPITVLADSLDADCASAAEGWDSGAGEFIEGFLASARENAEPTVVGGARRRAGDCRGRDGIPAGLGQFIVHFRDQHGAWQLQRRWQQQHTDLRQPSFPGPSAMTRTLQATVLHRSCRLLALLACITLAPAGCSAFNTSNSNDVSGNCNAVGGSNSAGCSSGQTAGAAPAAASMAPGNAPSHTSTGRRYAAWASTRSPCPRADYVPIGPSRPTRAQESTSPSGDLGYNTFSGEAYLTPVQPFSTIAPISGVPRAVIRRGSPGSQHTEHRRRRARKRLLPVRERPGPHCRQEHRDLHQSGRDQSGFSRGRAHRVERHLLIVPTGWLLPHPLASNGSKGGSTPTTSQSPDLRRNVSRPFARKKKSTADSLRDGPVPIF